MKKNDGNELSDRRTGAARWFRIRATGAVAVTAAIFLLLAPVVLGSSSVVMTAPYSGVLTTTSSSWGVAGCAHAGVASKGHFNSRTGLGGLGVWAVLPNCPRAQGSGSDAATGFVSSVPVKLTHKNDSVVAVVLVRAWVAAHLTLGVCTKANTNYSYCYEIAYADLVGYVYLVDTTSGATWFASTYSVSIIRALSFDSQCYAGNCSTQYGNATGPYQSSLSYPLMINATSVTTTDTFLLVVAYSGYAEAYESAYGATITGAQASASVNAGTAGEHIDLASITIS
jgi:hypothetical protein